REWLRIRRAVHDAGAQHQPVPFARIAGGSPLPELVGGEIRRRERGEPEHRVRTREQRTKGRASYELVALAVDDLQAQDHAEHGDSCNPGPTLREEAGRWLLQEFECLLC